VLEIVTATSATGVETVVAAQTHFADLDFVRHEIVGQVLGGLERLALELVRVAFPALTLGRVSEGCCQSNANLSPLGPLRAL